MRKDKFMKKTILMTALAVILTVSLAACGGKAADTASTTDTGVQTTAAETTADSGSADPSAINTADGGWIKLDIPGGYKQIKESDQYITIQNESNTNQYVRITRDYLMDRTLDDMVRGQISNDPGKYSKGADGAFSGFEWQVVNYQSNGLDCRMLFCLCGDGDHYLRVTAIGLTENDFALQVILGNITLNASEL